MMWLYVIPGVLAGYQVSIESKFDMRQALQAANVVYIGEVQTPGSSIPETDLGIPLLEVAVSTTLKGTAGSTERIPVIWGPARYSDSYRYEEGDTILVFGGGERSTSSSVTYRNHMSMPFRKKSISVELLGVFSHINVNVAVLPVRRGDLPVEGRLDGTYNSCFDGDDITFSAASDFDSENTVAVEVWGPDESITVSGFPNQSTCVWSHFISKLTAILEE